MFLAHMSITDKYYYLRKPQLILPVSEGAMTDIAITKRKAISSHKVSSTDF